MNQIKSALLIIAIFTVFTVALATSAPALAQEQQPATAARNNPTAPPSSSGQPGMMGGMGMMGHGGMMGGKGMMHGCPEMMMMNEDPKTRGQMMQVRGRMMQQMGEIMIKRGKELEQTK